MTSEVTDLIEPTPKDLRLLRLSARKLWAALIRARERGGEGPAVWFFADLRQLAHNARIAYSTATAGLAELKHAGLVASSRMMVPRWCRNRASKQIENVMCNEHNLYLVIGEYDRRSGMESIRFPRRAWLEFVDARTSRRRSELPGKIRVEAFRCKIPGAEWRIEWCAEFGRPSDRDSQKRSADLTAKPSTSVTLKSNTKSLSPSEKEMLSSRAPSSLQRSGTGVVYVPALDANGNRFIESASIGFGFDRPPSVRLPGKATQVALDPALPLPMTVTWLGPELVPAQRAMAVVEGFRRAIAKVYGTKWWGWTKGDITKAKGYKGLLACGDQMIEHSVPPEHWAIWRLEWFKSKCPRWAKSPPPIHVVMSAKRLSERAGWFRKEYVLPLPTVPRDDLRIEQGYRNEEASRRHAGADEFLIWMLFPRWYKAKRDAEIADGLRDPHDNWPTRAKHESYAIDWST